MTQTHYDANDVLMGGAGAPAWKFNDPGTTYTGIIAIPPIARQERDYDPNNPGGGALKFFPSGDPIMGIVIELDTDERNDPDDNGRRTFYVEGRYIKEAVRGAVLASGSQKLNVGDRLTVTFTHREDPMDKRSRKYWKVEHAPGAQVQLMEPTEQPEQAGQGSPWPQQQATAPSGQQQAAPPAQQPTQQVPPAQQPAQQTTPPAPQTQPAAGPTPEQVAAVRSAGLDPASVFPGQPLPAGT